ncbi:hypothetical protein LPE509_01500 [Legionella pneumophila subsp. pneumophila LPE509]|nr:hypothetical protein LPE509_01500 [Legionella pneumophila subsp. pneumophila LPE509]
MKRWDFVEMTNTGSKLFASTHKRKKFAHHKLNGSYYQ